MGYQKKANADFEKYKKKMEKYKTTAGYKKWAAERAEWKKEQKKNDGKKVLKAMLKNEPKRPMTAYFLFMNEMREEWANEDMAFTEIGKKAAKIWGDMTDGKKKQYNDMYAKNRKAYEKKLDAYHKTAEYKKYMAARDEFNAQQKAAKKIAKKTTVKVAK